MPAILAAVVRAIAALRRRWTLHPAVSVVPVPTVSGRHDFQHVGHRGLFSCHCRRSRFHSVTGRSDTTIKLRWKPLGAEITKLVMQYAILNGKNTFVDVKKNGGKDCVLADPQSIESYVVKRLKPDTDYVFRLIAYNASGKSTGAGKKKSTRVI